MRIPIFILAALLSFCCAAPKYKPVDISKLLGPLPAQKVPAVPAVPVELAPGKHPTAHVRFVGGINMKSALDLAEAMYMVQVSTPTPEFILLEIDSVGGSVQSGFLMTKMVEESPVPVYCIVDGKAASMAFYVLQGCKLRFMTARSTLTVHEPAQVLPSGRGTRQDYMKDAERLRTLNISMSYFWSRRLNISREEFLRRIDDKDWVMSAPEAFGVKAVDQVVMTVDQVLHSLRDDGRL
jgi:ATP-dependent protease ClpP protease subunit